MLKKIRKIFHYILYIFIIYIFIDFIILRFCFNLGCPRDVVMHRIFVQTPYTSYILKPLARSDKYNILYDEEKSIFKELKKDDLKVAFFAGSTGLIGIPSITELIEKKLEEKLNTNVFLVNFSVFASQSRQHMHMLLEYTDAYKEMFNPDIVIFYNGFNELNQPYCFDPRPGYPYNYYFTESPEWKKFLIRYSAIFGYLEWEKAKLTKLSQLKQQVKILSPEWKKEIIDNYFGTYKHSKEIVENMNSQYFDKALFFGFFQPFHYFDKCLEDLTPMVEDEIKNYDYLYNVHDLYDKLDSNIWQDECHVHGEAHIVMSEKIADTIYKHLKEKNLLNKLPTKK